MSVGRWQKAQARISMLGLQPPSAEKMETILKEHHVRKCPLCAFPRYTPLALQRADMTEKDIGDIRPHLVKNNKLIWCPFADFDVDPEPLRKQWEKRHQQPCYAAGFEYSSVHQRKG